jgi:hypothetical protein
MQKERLIVKNFFTLKDIDIELSKYNVFIGEQASGKSLITKLLYFFREVFTTYIPSYPQDLNELGNVLCARFMKIFNNPVLDNTEIVYHLGDYSIKLDLKNQIFVMSDNLAALYIDCVTLLKNDNAYRNSNVKIQLAPQEYSILLGKIYNTFYDYIGISNKFLPAGRMMFFSLFNNIFNLISTQQLNLNPLLIEFGQNYQQAFSRGAFLSSTKDRELFEEFSAKILKGKYVYDQLGGFIDQDNHQTRPVDASSGQQEFLPVYMILRDMLAFHSGNLYIEEPEAHLYPTAQKYMLELLVYVANATSSHGLYITTHSPYILTVLNNLIMANEVRDKQKTYEPNLLVSFNEVRAYFIADGKAQDLRDTESKLIIATELDSVSEQNATEFEDLLDLKYDE